MEMKPLYHKQAAIFLCIFIFFLLACDATFSVGFPTATFTPPTQTATATPPSLKLTLTSIPYSENNIEPPSTITAQIPQLVGSDDPRVTAFNQAIADIVQTEIESFKLGLNGLPNPPQITTSTFDAKYNVLYQGGDIWSIKFDIAIYVDGAAHPGDLNHTLNYDFANSKILSLSDLFLPKSNYLKAISKYCSDELAMRDIAFNESSLGAEPTAENYRNWNLTADGLMITFERGQVAAYAAPAQIVTISYQELTALIDPKGLLVGFLK